MSGIAWNPDDTTADEKVCQYWASRTSVETDRVHTMQWYGPSGSPVWIGQCLWCGWVDGNELAERIAELIGRPLEEWPLVSRDNEIEQLRAELAQVRGDHERMVAVHADAYAEMSQAAAERAKLDEQRAIELANLRDELELVRPVVEAAKAWRAGFPKQEPYGFADQVEGVVDNRRRRFGRGHTVHGEPEALRRLPTRMQPRRLLVQQDGR